ncbi:MAG: hypothetical protein RI949_158 [Pseudomonadota bacterium]
MIAVADAVVTTGATVVKAGVKTVGAVVDAVIPEKKPEPEKDKRQSDYKTAPHTTTGSASSRIPKRP